MRPSSTPRAGKLEPRKQEVAKDALIDRLTTAAWIFDIDHGRVVWANTAALDVWRADSLVDLSARDMHTDMSAAVRRRLRQYQDDFTLKGAVFTELWTIYPEGVPRTLRVRFSGIELSGGRMGMFCEGNEENAHPPDTLRSIDALIHTQLMISLYTETGDLLYLNPAARRAYTNPDRLSSRFLLDSDFDTILASLKISGEISQVVQVATSDGLRWHELTARSCHDAVSAKPAILISEVDVSELKEAEARANHIAFNDQLTGLPNRAAIERLFASSIETAHAENRIFGVLFIDLDQFKLINDTLGHACGDEVLLAVACRLKSVCGENEYILRLGGDEFLMLISDGSRDAYSQRAERILAALSKPIHVAGQLLTVTTSIGISSYPKDGVDQNSLMRNADLAMYEAKAMGRDCFRHFDPVMNNDPEQSLAAVSDVRSGLLRGEFEVYYQPRVSCTDLAIIGAEALVRWNHPVRGLVGPSEFIPLCEETGLIEPLGNLVMQAAMAQQKTWSDQGHSLSVSINVSQRQLASEKFIGVLADTLAATGCDPGMIELEFTESMLDANVARSQFVISNIKRMGLLVSLDDFGTGYSNLARLNENPVDAVKIDRSFIKSVPSNPAVTEMIIAMCSLLNVKVIAEGIETEEQLTWIRGQYCHELQGFYFSKPVPVAEFDKLLADAGA